MSSLVLSRDEHTAAYLPVQEMQKAIVLAQICLYGATLRFPLLGFKVRLKKVYIMSTGMRKTL